MDARRARSRAPLAMLLAALSLGGTAAGCDRGKTLQAYPDELAGVGIVLQTSAQGQVIDKLVLGGPAADAGLREGDRIVAVDGEPTDGKTLASVVGSLRGKAGSNVAVTVDGGASGRSVVTLTRRTLEKGAKGAAYHLR